MDTSRSIASATVGKHAIVYGGSMAGLIAAGVLSRHFERVTLVERDLLEEGAQSRKGVPQGMHVHALLMRGMNILCDVFPGFLEDLKAAGGQVIDTTEKHAWFINGAWRQRTRCGIDAYTQARPLLESVARRRLMAVANVSVLKGREVSGFQTSADKHRITGVHVRAPSGGQEETLEGELVVDASGRGSRTPQWLEALGYPRVEETRIQVDVVYASRIYRRPPGFEPGWETLSLTPKLPKERRVAILQPIEGNCWQVLLGGWLGEGPATPDDAGFLEFARGLSQPHVYEAIRNAEPVGPIHTYRFSHSQRRHYERMSRFPEGLVLVGDAFCSFTPIYGQGITTGAIQAEALGECLRQGLGGVSQRYRKRVGQLLQVPWTMATSGDLRFPEVKGKRPLAGSLLNWFGDRFQNLTMHDPEALKTFLRVLHLVESPAAMFSPRMLLKVLSHSSGAAPQNNAPAPLSASRHQAA